MKAAWLVVALIGAVAAQALNGFGQGQTTISVASSTNPSTVGQLVTFSATLGWPPESTNTPTGPVNLLDGNTVLGSTTINAITGQATITTSALAAGSHSITASYAGDANFAGSTSVVLTQVVNSAGKTATRMTLDSSQNPSPSGQPVTFTASVAGPAGATVAPTGSVTFLDGAASLGYGSVNATAMASFTTSTLSIGSHSITAQYIGDGNFLGSTSLALTQAVGTPNFTLSVNPATVMVSQGSSGTTTVTVTPALGLNQQVRFACSGLPAALSCSFSPNALTPNGTANVSTKLTIASSAVAAVRTRAPVQPGVWKGMAGGLLAVILIGPGGIARGRRRWRSILGALLLLPVLGLSVGGCIVGGSGLRSQKGSSMVTLTATSGALTQTTAFTLNVQ